MSLLSFSALLLCCSAIAQTPTLTSAVTLAQGSFLGADRDAQGVLAFKGIPYAAPPVGPLRWKAPQPALRSATQRDATKFGTRCLQLLAGPARPGLPQGEDCLTLNVWTAAQSAKEKRPVMVWIHGGGFEFGSSADAVTNGAAFAAKGVVLVSLNYRLGVFGFLALQDLDREGPSGDYGLQDQIAALRWVKENIAAFGGDGANVTVFGESAGAHAVGLLMASPLMKGLAAKAIGESGAFWDSEHGPLSTFDEAHARGLAFKKTLGVSTLEEMRALPADTLVTATLWNLNTDPGTTAFSPSVDGFVLPELPGKRFAEGKQLRIPLLAGWNAKEESLFVPRELPHQSAAAFRQAAIEVFGASRIDEFLKLYPAEDAAEAKVSADALVGDMAIAEQTWQWLDLQRRTGKVPTYGYKFVYTSAFSPVAMHTAEVTFVFGTLVSSPFGPKRLPTDADHKLSDEMMGYWVNFATRGDPNGPGLPPWPRFDGSTVLELGETLTPKSEAQLDRFRFLASFRSQGTLPLAWRQIPMPDPVSPRPAGVR